MIDNVCHLSHFLCGDMWYILNIINNLYKEKNTQWVSNKIFLFFVFIKITLFFAVIYIRSNIQFKCQPIWIFCRICGYKELYSVCILHMLGIYGQL